MNFVWKIVHVLEPFSEIKLHVFKQINSPQSAGRPDRRTIIILSSQFPRNCMRSNALRTMDSLAPRSTFVIVAMLLLGSTREVFAARAVADQWTRTPSGCSCYFERARTDCACCHAGGCQCTATHRHQCVKCGIGSLCGLSMDLDFWTASRVGCDCYFDRSRNDCACCKNGGCQCASNYPHQCVPCGYGELCGKASIPIPEMVCPTYIPNPPTSIPIAKMVCPPCAPNPTINQSPASFSFPERKLYDQTRTTPREALYRTTPTSTGVDQSRGLAGEKECGPAHLLVPYGVALLVTVGLLAIALVSTLLYCCSLKRQLRHYKRAVPATNQVAAIYQGPASSVSFSNKTLSHSSPLSLTPAPPRFQPRDEDDYLQPPSKPAANAYEGLAKRGAGNEEAKRPYAAGQQCGDYELPQYEDLPGLS